MLYMIFLKDTLKGKKIVLSIAINLMSYYRFKKVIEQIKYKNYFNNF